MRSRSVRWRLLRRDRSFARFTAAARYWSLSLAISSGRPVAVSKLTSDRLALVTELANLPEQIRGFGHVKLESVQKAKARWRWIEQALNTNRDEAAGHKKAA